MYRRLAAAALAAAFALTGCTANADPGSDYRGPSLGGSQTVHGSLGANPLADKPLDGTLGDRLTTGDTAPSLACDLAAGCTFSGSLGMSRHPGNTTLDGTTGDRLTVKAGDRR